MFPGKCVSVSARVVSVFMSASKCFSSVRRVKLCVSVHVCVRMCVCVCERERERERDCVRLRARVFSHALELAASGVNFVEYFRLRIFAAAGVPAGHHDDAAVAPDDTSGL